MDTSELALIKTARDWLNAAERVVVLTGAGMSAESGIPTFRQAQTGLWETYSAEELATPDAWKRNSALVWGWYLWRMARVKAATPNAGHLALAEYAKSHEVCFVTQNVDDLHERAGSKSVLHLHGRIFAHRCFQCGQAFDAVTIPSPDDTPAAVSPPRCQHCEGEIRPGVVWFGESLPHEVFSAAVEATQLCDVMLVIGTAGVVYPAASLAAIAQRHGARVIEINPQNTELSALADICLRGGAAEVLPPLLMSSD